ncbi:MAG: hypothetical protein ACRDRN_18125 [Sciscionella sp.]
MSAGGVIGFIVLICLFIAAMVAYDSFKKNGFRPRTVDTELSVDEVREIFCGTVAGKGWSIVDEGNPMIAQSGLLAGIRQQIALHTEETDEGTHAHITVIRYARKVFGGTTKAYTLRWRMTAFLNEVQRTDSNALVAG